MFTSDTPAPTPETGGPRRATPRRRTRRVAVVGLAAAALVVPSVVLAEDAPATDDGTDGIGAPLDDDGTDGIGAPLDDDGTDGIGAPLDDDGTDGIGAPLDDVAAPPDEPGDPEPAAPEPASTTTTTTVPAAEPPPGETQSEAPDPTDVTTTTTTTTAAPTATTTVPPAPPQPVGLDITILPNRLQHVLATIRYLESRNTYDIPPNKGNASGAYQFIESTWNNYGGYRHAYQAPPAVQDERAVIDVQLFLDRFDGDVSMVPVMWYFPRAVREPALMDVVPKPEHGNVLTIREYQARWMAVYAELSGEDLPPILTAAEAALRAGLPPEVSVGEQDLAPVDVSDRIGDDDAAASLESAALAAPIDLTLTYPVLGPSRMASLECATETDVDRATTTVVVDGDTTIEISPARQRNLAEEAGLCAEQAPGVVFGVKLQPVLAVADGVITEIDDEPGSERPISMVVTTPGGTSIEYRGFNDDSPGTDDGAAPDHLRLSALARVGGIVRAGQIIGFMGDSDPLPPSIRADVPTDATETLDPDAAAPHIRITITDRFGRPVDAVGPIIDARARESCRVGIGGWSMPPTDGVVEPVTIETTDLHDDIDSEWVITATGQVWASGWAAMINPVELCGWVPSDQYGPGAEGSTDWLPHWWQPYDLPTELWVELALRDDSTPDAFVLPG